MNVLKIKVKQTNTFRRGSSTQSTVKMTTGTQWKPNIAVKNNSVLDWPSQRSDLRKMERLWSDSWKPQTLSNVKPKRFYQKEAAPSERCKRVVHSTSIWGCSCQAGCFFLI